MAFGCFGFLGGSSTSNGSNSNSHSHSHGHSNSHSNANHPSGGVGSKSKKMARAPSGTQRAKPQSQSQSQSQAQSQAQAAPQPPVAAQGQAEEQAQRRDSEGEAGAEEPPPEHSRSDTHSSHPQGADQGAGLGSGGGEGRRGPGPEGTGTGTGMGMGSSRRGGSFKRTSSKSRVSGGGGGGGGGSNSGAAGPVSDARGADVHPGVESPPSIPRVNSHGKQGLEGRGEGAERGEREREMSKSRSLRRHLSDKAGPQDGSPGGSGNTDSPSGQFVGRGMKITQNLKPPPAKAPQPQFSLSKKKPKDAAAEARLQEEASKLDDLLKSSDLRAFSYQELKAATRGFSMDTLIGAGGFGKVYHGVVKLSPPHPEAGAEPVSAEVAIKRLEAKSLQGHKEWMVEICMLGLVDHAHLVKLLGFCAEGEKRLLVYEFLPYYSLDRYLFALDPQQPILDWHTRLNIALGSARGLAHLHEEISPPIIYRDFKTSNILLDEDFTPKLSDFGLAREGPSLDRTHVSTQVRGTAGYAAPEYMLTGHLTPKADVWSFGVVLLEMLTGRPSIDQRRPQHEMKLVPLARQRLQGPGDILELMDPNLEGQFPPQAAAKLAEVAKWCLQSDPGNRPLMSELVEVLAYLSRPDWDDA